MKQFIRKISAVGTSLAMFGMTVGGAVAADLADLPAPFVADGSYVSTAMVIGSTADAAARNTLKTYFDGSVSTSVGETTSSTDTEKLYVGDSADDEFGATLDDGDLDGLWDDSITFEGESYETSETVVLSTQVRFVTSGTENEEELGLDAVVMTNGTDSWSYRYNFDEAFSDVLSSSDDLDIEFLGTSITLTGSANSGDHWTMTTGANYAMGMDESVAVGGHTLYVGTIFETSVEVWVDNEDHEFMSEGDSETFDIGTDQVEVTLDDIGYTDDVSSRTVLLRAGEDISSVVGDTDAVQAELGEPDVDDDGDDAVWNWDNNVIANNNISSGDYIGIAYHQKINKHDDEPLPLQSGESWSSPYGYLTLDFDVVEPSYKEYTISFEDNYDVNSTVEEDVIIFEANDGGAGNDGFILNSEDTSKVACNATGTCWYEDNDGDFALIAGTTAIDDNTTFYIESGTGTTKYVSFYNTSNSVTNASRMETIGSVRIEDTASADDGDEYSGGYLQMNVTIGSQQLGGTAEDADASDLGYSKTGSSVVYVGTWDEGDLMTAYGTQALDIESNADNDQVVLMVPEDELYAEFTFSLRGAGSSSAEADLLTADEDTSGYSNLVLVGGPAVNSVTASFMGLAFPSYGDASTIAPDTALVKLVEQGGQTALIVAGWEAGDTQRGASAVNSGGLSGASHIA